MPPVILSFMNDCHCLVMNGQITTSSESIFVYSRLFFLHEGVIERTRSEERTVVGLALDFIARSKLLPNVALKTSSRSLEVSSSGLDYILAGSKSFC